MIFIDANSWFTHHELNQEIEELEDNKDYYKKEITKDQKSIKNLKDPAGLEKFARETYFMKKEEEEIFIIEYQDSVSTSEN